MPEVSNAFLSLNSEKQTLLRSQGRVNENPFFTVVNDAFVALAVAVVLAPSDRFCDFSFPSYVSFREGTRPTRQKSLPPPHCTMCILLTSFSFQPNKLRLTLKFVFQHIF